MMYYQQQLADLIEADNDQIEARAVVSNKDSVATLKRGISVRETMRRAILKEIARDKRRELKKLNEEIENRKPATKLVTAPAIQPEDVNWRGPMASEKQIAVNRANAKRSTGPKSAFGKLRSSRNAVRYRLSRPLALEATSAEAQAIAHALIADDFTN